MKAVIRRSFLHAASFHMWYSYLGGMIFEVRPFNNSLSRCFLTDCKWNRSQAEEITRRLPLLSNEAYLRRLGEGSLYLNYVDINLLYEETNAAYQKALLKSMDDLT